jgi:hypothetical protein
MKIMGVLGNLFDSFMIFREIKTDSAEAICTMPESKPQPPAFTQYCSDLYQPLGQRTSFQSPLILAPSASSNGLSSR